MKATVTRGGEFIGQLIPIWLFAIIMVGIISASASAQNLVLTGPENVTSPDFPGVQQTPRAVFYNGQTYVFWSSYAASQDYDIKYAVQGESGNWEAGSVTDGQGSYEHTPLPIVYDSQIFLFWSTDDLALTDGEVDIAYSVFDGTSWTSISDLTAEINDYDEYNPSAVIFNGQLHIFFEMFNMTSSHEEIGHMSFDGSSWSDLGQITQNSDGHNLNPRTAASNNRLMLAWESYDSILAGSSTGAIIAQYLEAGEWSLPVRLSPQDGSMNTEPVIAALDGNFLVAWSTNSTQISQGQDNDIVCRWFMGGQWSGSVEEISQGSSGTDTGPWAITIGQEIYLGWITNDTTYSTGQDTDIVLRTYDFQWSNSIEISVDSGNPDGGGMTYKTPWILETPDAICIFWEANALPTVIGQTEPTWISMASLEYESDSIDNTIYWVALIGFVCLVFTVLGIRKHRQR